MLTVEFEITLRCSYDSDCETKEEAVNNLCDEIKKSGVTWTAIDGHVLTVYEGTRAEPDYSKHKFTKRDLDKTELNVAGMKDKT